MTRMITVALLALVLGATSGVAQNTERSPAKAAPTATAPVNLNTATVSQLETLPGIGTRTAERILEYRQKNGGFKKVEELMNVRGVGEKSFLRIKPMITITAAKTERAAQ